VLELIGVSKHFRGLKAVSEASLRVDAGEIVALIGPNGAGKTTLFNLVAGVLEPTSGRIVFEGRDIAGLRPTETDEMVAVFRRLNAEQGITILLIEHVMRAVMALARRVYVLHHGEIIAAGTPVEVTRNPRVLESYLGSEAIA
jgi:ABC-type branched-subunit amino acid transport system ATPase component